MLDIPKLYPQYRVMPTRRTQNIPVTFERRSGMDRRAENRVQLDNQLTRDIFEVKNKIASLQNPEMTPQTKIANVKNTEKVASHNVASDIFVKRQAQNINTKTADKIASAQNTAALGVAISVLGGIVFASTFGPMAAGVAIGIGAYIGGKGVKEIIVAHLTDKKMNSSKKS